MRIHAVPDPDPGQTLEPQKVEFLHENHTYEGTEIFLKGRKAGLFFVNFG
jgi:hypothetical protein